MTFEMVPRERYSGMEAALDSRYEHMRDVPSPLIVVDGGLPAEYYEWLKQKSETQGFTLVYENKKQDRLEVVFTGR